jgi:hypothetical protein
MNVVSEGLYEGRAEVQTYLLRGTLVNGNRKTVEVLTKERKIPSISCSEFYKPTC